MENRLYVSFRGPTRGNESSMISRFSWSLSYLFLPALRCSVNDTKHTAADSLVQHEGVNEQGVCTRGEKRAG